ncbi:hypothetical protein V6N12_058931 [Hibiscus sabdariffa]|uniref:Uncharacterized protein n=1 Tax=Hibiscus sabdariffa TaxID=183260 RepID=A0ABR2EVG2_9ROSI
MPNEWHTPLEVPGNRLPETGSGMKLLNVRGACGYKKVTAFSPRNIKYKQDRQLFGLRDKPITKQDALPRSEFQPRLLPGQDPLSL